MAAKFIYAVLLVLLAGFESTWQISLPSDPTYHAGVVEFIPASEGTARDRVKDNMLRMRAIIESEDTRDLDILVFPEYVLNNMERKTFIPDPKDHIAPCDSANYDLNLVELSCSARSRGLYVVLNILEKEKCDTRSLECTASGYNTYNTNVVLDRHGVVISRYRKTHLYGNEWTSTNVRRVPELATFETDFGVTFGHFICFDMLFYDPALKLVKELNITDIIYPTYWFSELPFLTAVQLQEGWAYANNVNLLAADASKPSGQNTGSGIYAGKLGRLTAVIHQEPTTRLLKALVPKHGQQSAVQLPPVIQPVFTPQLETPRFTRLSLLRDYNVDIFETKLLGADFTSASEIVCHHDFCCNFEATRTIISQSTMHSAYRYRLAAYSGSDSTFQRKDPSDLSICAIIACTSEDLWSCGHIFSNVTLVGNKFYFNSIKVSGHFRHSPRRAIMPSSVDGVIMPLPLSMYQMTETESLNDTAVEITLTSPKSDLLTFGIWANYYTNEVVNHNVELPLWAQTNPIAPGNSSSGSMATSLLVLLVALISFVR